MKVLLIQPPIQDFYRTSIRTQPIGLAYLASSLQANGHEVEILDCQTAKKRSMSLPPELLYLKDFYPFNDRSPFKLYSGYYHFGMGWEEIKRRIENSKADVFGVSSSFTPYHREALEIAGMIKEWDRRKIVVMGGAHVSCDPEGVLRSPLIDYAILGEGEIRFPLLVGQIERGKTGRPEGMDGVGYRINGAIRINPLQSFILDLDSLPYPARDLLDLDRYRIRKKRATVIITSRGCPHGCAYCSTHLIMGDSFRTRTPEAIVGEMVGCRERFGIQTFDIEDDNFTFGQERAKRLMTLLIENFGEQGVELTAMNGVSFASLDGELLKLMNQAGFHTLNLSFVSAVSSTRKKMGRPEAERGFDAVLEETAKVGLNVIAYAIFGMPGQTVEEMVETLIYLMGKKVLIGPSVYYPTPGTDLFRRCQETGILPSVASQWRSSALPIQTREFGRLDIVTLFRLARVINFVKGKMDEGELTEGTTWREFYRILKDRRGVQEKGGLHFSFTGNNEILWMDLLLSIVEERSFFSLRRDPAGETSISKEASSGKVLDYFFEKAWEKPILRSRHDRRESFGHDS